jgi:hypothetical protein
MTQWQALHCNRGTVFSVLSEKLVSGWGQFGNPEEVERLSLEPSTKQPPLKTVTDCEDLVCLVVAYEVCRTVRA